MHNRFFGVRCISKSSTGTHTHIHTHQALAMNARFMYSRITSCCANIAKKIAFCVCSLENICGCVDISSSSNRWVYYIDWRDVKQRNNRKSYETKERKCAREREEYGRKKSQRTHTVYVEPKRLWLYKIIACSIRFHITHTQTNMWMSRFIFIHCISDNVLIFKQREKKTIFSADCECVNSMWCQADSLY